MEKDDYEYKHMTSNKDYYSILKENAKVHRKNPTEAEMVLWQYLRNNGLGVKFRQQHPILDFIADFICLEKHLIIEVDGEYHFTEEQIENDNQRSNRLYKKGYYIMRFTNEQVISSTEEVVEKIKETIKNINTTPKQ